MEYLLLLYYIVAQCIFFRGIEIYRSIKCAVRVVGGNNDRPAEIAIRVLHYIIRTTRVQYTYKHDDVPSRSSTRDFLNRADKSP